MPVSDAVSGDPLPIEQLEASLWAIADDAAQRGPAQDAVGALSGDDRDSWTRARENLLALSPANRATATAIEDSLFVLALDPSTLKSERYVSSSPSRDTPDLDAHIRVASSANGTGRNRWWDKAVQIVVENSGRATMIGEHSPCDALIPSIVCDYALAEDLDASGASRRGAKHVADATSGIKKLEWVVDESTREAIDHASKTVAEIAADSEGRMLWYDEYGAGWIKTVGESVAALFLPCTRSFFPRVQPNNPPMPTSRWRSSSRTTRRTTSRRPLTRRRRRVCSVTAAPRSSARSAKTVGAGSRPCVTRRRM